MNLRALLIPLAPLVAAAVVLPSGAAVADTVARADAAGDVLKSDGSTETKDPTQKIGDITRTVIAHGPARVTVKIKHRDLVKTGRTQTYVAVASSKGMANHRSLTVTAAPGSYAGKVRVYNARGKAVACRGVTRTINYAANTTQVSIPRSCLGSPKWVRVGVGVISAQPGVAAAFVDDARGNGTLGKNDPFLSKRIYR